MLRRSLLRTQQLRHRDLIQQNAEAANNAGITAATKGDLDTAIRELRRAIEQKPDLADAHYNLGGIYRQRGRFSDAAEEFRRAIQAKPEFLSARSELASLLDGERDWKGAVEQYEQILNLRPGDLESRYSLADALAQLGRTRSRHNRTADGRSASTRQIRPPTITSVLR